MTREKALYEALLETLNEDLQLLQTSASALAELDTLNTLAERADKLNFCRPQLQTARGINITQGRHPVVEQVLDNRAPFIPNDVDLHHEQRMLIITGPNMGGKSTYMRQTALITLLAHIGSYVPAQSATIGLVDRIFTRIGSADDLAGGRSTFMVEMTETANILQNASERSLVLMDEIGRGTSTFDGLSLAWACAEHLARDIQALCLFATHYFEITSLPDQCDGVSNCHLSAAEHKDSIVFLYSIQTGAANQSYGLQVAKLAGIPQTVIQEAQRQLTLLENGEHPHSIEHPIQKPSTSVPEKQVTQKKEPIFKQQDLFSSNHPAILQLEQVNPNELSPRAALDLIYELHQLIQ